MSLLTLARQRFLVFFKYVWVFIDQAYELSTENRYRQRSRTTLDDL